jgi:hypothetical protein
MEKLTPLQLQARDELWRRGELSWILRPVQREIYAKIKESLRRGESLKYFLNCSRRIGKTFTLCDIAAETAIKQKQTNIFDPVRFGAPTQKALKKIVRPIFRTIFQTAPADIRPVWRASDDMYLFPFGAEIHIAGVNNEHEDDLRGTSASLCLLDEIGFMDQLDYLIEDVMMPQLLTTGGNLIMAGTPPRSPAHAYMTFAMEAQSKGNYAEYTIEQSGYRPEVIEKFIAEAGGRESTTCQREYFCKMVVDKNFAIIPEWTDSHIVDYPRHEQLFQFYHRYESMDVGGRDKTALLFGYYDFQTATLVLEDELLFEGPQTTSGVIGGGVKEKEKTLWPDKVPVSDEQDPKKRPPANIFLRVADNNNIILLQDLGQEQNLHFLATSKDSLPAMVNKVRMWVIAGRIKVNPRCRELIGCLKYGIWNDKRTEFDRSTAYGHFDALASLIYMVRNVDERSNPIPPNFGPRLCHPGCR